MFVPFIPNHPYAKAGDFLPYAGDIMAEETLQKPAKEEASRAAEAATQRKELDSYHSRGCVKPEHESAVKKGIWVRSLGLGDSRGEEECSLLHQVLQKPNVRLMIWGMFGLTLEEELPFEIVTPATNVKRGRYGSFEVEKMLFKCVVQQIWQTDRIQARHEESVILKVPDESIVTGFHVATMSASINRQVRVEEVNVDGTIGAELQAWCHFGTQHPGGALGYQPSDYTPESISVWTTATQFKVSVRQTGGDGWTAGLAIFRAVGVAAPEVRSPVARFRSGVLLGSP